ncbi:MAG: hypothetical protein H6832_01965 [Planctomycetes bacterium]|nr:hypothetical protein [Planctomycetota bacterium]
MSEYSIFRRSVSRVSCAICAAFLALLSSIAGARALPQAAPAVDMYGLLGRIECYPDAGFVTVRDVDFAFMPESALYRGQGDHAYPVSIVVRKVGGSGEIGRYKLGVQPTHTVFSRGNTFGSPMECHLKEPGDYILSIELDKTTIVSVPFTAKHEASGDAFNPVTRVFLDGAWPHYACLAMHRLGDLDHTPVLRTWIRGGMFNKKKDETLGIEVYDGADLIFVSAPVHKSNLLSDSNWRASDAPLQFRTGDGGGPIKLRDLVKKDGDYLVVRKREGEMTGAWKLVIRNGKPVAHPRSKLDYDPPQDRLIGRSSGPQQREGIDLCWLEEVSLADANAALSKGGAAAAGPSAEMLARWTSKVASHAGAAKLALTDVDCRMDGTMEASDSIIAFATGGGNGVGYLKIGEDKAQSIPDGQSYSGRMFQVCGTKIVLTNRNTVAVFDTATGKTHAIPETEISLSKTFAEMYGATILAADGFLVGTLNDPKKVTDRSMFKVLDVSGDEPKIIVLDNIDIPVRDLTCVTVDAETGRFGVVSQRSKKFWIAPVVPGARFREYDVSGHDGVHRNAQLRLEGSHALLFDEVGKPKLRAVSLEDGQNVVIGTIGKQMNSFTATPSHVAFVTDESYGSNYHVKKGSIGGKFESAANSGKSGPGGGNFGLGSSLALTSGGLLVLAGQGKGGIGSGEFLQIDDGSGWAIVAGPDGEPLNAVDVRQGPGVIAFKTGSRNDTKVAYLLTGAKADFGGLKLLR